MKDKKSYWMSIQHFSSLEDNYVVLIIKKYKKDQLVVNDSIVWKCLMGPSEKTVLPSATNSSILSEKGKK